MPAPRRAPLVLAQGYVLDVAGEQLLGAGARVNGGRELSSKSTGLGNARRTPLVQASIDSDPTGKTLKQVEAFEQEAQIKAFGALVFFIGLFIYARTAFFGQ